MEGSASRFNSREMRTLLRVHRVEIDSMPAELDEVTRRVLQLEIEEKALEKVQTDDAQAYDFYLRGRSHIHQLRRKGFDHARQMFARAIAIDPDDAWAMNNLGLVLIRQGRWDEALMQLEAVREVRPNDDALARWIRRATSALEGEEGLARARGAAEKNIMSPAGRNFHRPLDVLLSHDLREIGDRRCRQQDRPRRLLPLAGDQR